MVVTPGKGGDATTMDNEMVVTTVVEFADLPDTVRSMLVCATWCECASSDVVWERHCRRRWRTKVSRREHTELDLINSNQNIRRMISVWPTPLLFPALITLGAAIPPHR